MTSRFATLAAFFFLASFTSVALGQPGYYQNSLAPPNSIPYPQTTPAGVWNAGSPTGFSALTGQATPARAMTPLPAVPGYTPSLMGNAPVAPTYLPAVAGYSPATPSYPGVVAGQPQPNAGYYFPAAASQSPPTYWSATPPQAGYAAPPHPATHGYFAPVAYGHGGPAPAGPPATSHNPFGPGGSAQPPANMQQGQQMPLEGSVLNQPIPSAQPQPSMRNQPQVVPYDGATVVGGGAYYGVPAASGMYDVTMGSAVGYGYGNGYGYGSGFGNARFGSGAVGCTSPWFVGFGGLVMSRDNENDYLFSYDDANESRQLTNSREANFDWAGGFEVNFGRMFNCGQNAVEAVYWGLFPTDGTTITTDGDTAGALNGILNWDQLNYGLDPLLNPWTADDFVNNSTRHMVRRQNEVHNIEINLISFLSGGGGYGGAYGIGGGGCGPGGQSCGKQGCGVCSGTSSCGGGCRGGACGGGSPCSPSLAGLGSASGAGGSSACGSPWSHDWLVGVRFFRFRDNLLFGAERAGGNGVFQDEDDEIYYNIDITNDLVGAQLGFSGAYAVNCRFALDYGVKFGVYGNQISHISEIGGSQGVATINNGPNAGVDFYVQNKKKDLAFLGEANLGLTWRFGNCWRAKVGYRAVAVTGVAHPTNQIWHDLRGIQDVRWVDSNGSLILHGGYARAEYRF